MSRNKPQINGYALFVKQVGLSCLSREMGRPVQQHEGYQKCGEMWQNLPQEEKDRWKMQAKNYKGSADYQTEKEELRERNLNRRAAEPPRAGRSVKPRQGKQRKMYLHHDVMVQREFYDFEAAGELDDWLQKRGRERDAVKDDIDWHVPRSSPEGRFQWIREHEWAAVSVLHWWFDVETWEHHPAELTLTVFSIQDGFSEERTRQFYIRHPDLEQSGSDEANLLYFEALRRSEEVHGIPLDNHGPRQDLHFLTPEDAIAKIAAFTKEHKFLFVPAADFNETVGCLMTMNRRHEATKGRSFDTIEPTRFVCLEDLAWALLRFKLKDPQIKHIDKVMSEDHWGRYNAHPQCLCNFHRRKKVQGGRVFACSQAKLKKRLYGLWSLLEEQYFEGVDDIKGPAFIPMADDEEEVIVPLSEPRPAPAFHEPTPQLPREPPASAFSPVGARSFVPVAPAPLTSFQRPSEAAAASRDSAVGLGRGSAASRAGWTPEPPEPDVPGLVSRPTSSLSRRGIGIGRGRSYMTAPSPFQPAAPTPVLGGLRLDEPENEDLLRFTPAPQPYAAGAFS